MVEPPPISTSPMEGVIEEPVETEEWVEGEWAPDPNEPRYCLCNQVSYGDMVACDNPDVRSSSFFYLIYLHRVNFNISFVSSFCQVLQIVAF